MTRTAKVAQAIKKEVSIIIHDELKDPRLGFVTITDVKISSDLREARIFFSVLGSSDDYKNTRQALDSALGFIRHAIGQRVRLRFVPQIIFLEDHTAEKAQRIEIILNEIKKEREERQKDVK